MKKYSRLTFQQRIVIAFMVKNKYSKNKIALELGVHPSTIGRELKRNASERGTYNFTFAEGFARDRKESKKRYIKFTEEMKSFVDRKLYKQWSPEQITGYCRANNIEMVSHESIYKYIYSDKDKGGYLWQNLRTQTRKRKNRNRKRQNRFIVNKRKLSERPFEANDKLRYGDWEIDLICGGNHQGFAVTAVERKSGFSLIH
ncbi:IS30 family transposase, partial [Elizabethkingia anophelis]|nr:IS30 family transposase [Elizabethkingia anophelis]